MIAFAFTRTDQNSARYFAAMAVALLFYTLGYFLEITAELPSEAMLALCMENVGIPLLAPFFLLMTMAFFRPQLLRPWMMIATLFYGGLMFFVVLTNEIHWLYYSSIEMFYNGSFYVAHLGKGPLYVLQQMISTFFMIVAYVLLIKRLMHGSAKLRSQIILFIMGSLFGFITNLVNFTGIFPSDIDRTPFALNIGLIFFALIIYNYKLLDIVPAAFRAAAEQTDDAMVVLDCEWGFVHCNEKAYELLPVLKDFSGTEGVVGAQWWPKELSGQSNGSVVFSIENTVTGKETLQRANISSIYSKRGVIIGILILLRDITQTTNMMSKLEELAMTDSLTGAFNRHYFMTMLEQQVALAKRHQLLLGILIMDIDNFKKVNDTYGHLAGDCALRQIVQAVTQQLRNDDVIARYGGEEFVILSVGKTADDLKMFAERLLIAVESESIEYEEHTIRVTASFGAVMVLPGQTYNDAMEAADKALYIAKNSGRNRVVLGSIETCAGTVLQR